MLIQDAPQRDQALDPSRSFIVQAPAGSGKTELLTQRFLRLLTTVKQPEEILAITFTKKSAAEMRSRIIHALQKSLENTIPEASHAKTTYFLAKSVLERDSKLQWNLIENPNRLRIQTMDAFNTYLTKQLPILSNFGAAPDISDDFHQLYEEAVHEFLSHLEENFEWSRAIEKLLIHLDNDIQKVAKLLINMLAKRDQWLPYVTIDARNPEIKKHLENYLSEISLSAMQEVTEKFPNQSSQDIVYLASYAGQNIKRMGMNSFIISCADLSTLPSPKIENKNIWLGIIELLLTKEFSWRKRLDKNLGFPPATAFQNPDEKKLAVLNKERMTQLITTLSANENLRLSFENLCLTPPSIYNETQWETLEALYLALRVVVAQLRLTFQKYGKIDYIENSLAALHALGDEENPTDLNLILDYQIKHILIDEFQDTSNNQYRLIERLISGWESNDGRTVFLVGDPMQSIYRFREAEVGLFIRTQKNGLGSIQLTSLILQVNFRSDPGIVHWVNAHFKHVLPKQEDISLGAVSYKPSLACTADDSSLNSAVYLHPKISEVESQADAIVTLIKDIKEKSPSQKIAILVRSRSHLISILPALKDAKMAYRAIDIDPLDARPVIQDLLALTAALLHPSDRVAWLAVLRAPWCGLNLADLLILCDESDVSIIQRLLNPQLLAKLSIEGQQRISRILNILITKSKERQRLSLRLWVESTWLLLGGAAAIKHASDLEDASSYFALLDKYGDKSDSIQIFQLQYYVSQLFAAPDTSADNFLQIMTIHNSKGLEFDVVILPHLEKKPPHDQNQLLLWLEQAHRNNTGLVIAPIRGIGQENDSIYEYIQRQHAIKSDFESGRLLYVAATRAKKALHLFFSLKLDAEDSTTILHPASKSLLEKLWNSISKEIKISSDINAQREMNEMNVNKLPYYLQRLTLSWKNPLAQKVPLDIYYHQQKMGFYLPNLHSKHIGTLIHNILQQLTVEGRQWWDNISFNRKQFYFKQYLLRVGFSEDEISETQKNIFLAIDNILKDPHGEWILRPHADAKNEYPLTAIIDGNIHSLIIDRTFIDKGIRWIIDYKTTTPKDMTLKKFLQVEVEKYKKQMFNYSSAFEALDDRPIKLGLYFPLVPAWIDIVR